MWEELHASSELKCQGVTTSYALPLQKCSHTAESKLVLLVDRASKQDLVSVSSEKQRSKSTKNSPQFWPCTFS